MARKSAEGYGMKQETFDNCDYEFKKNNCSIHSCRMEGNYCCPTYLKYEMTKIKNKILPQVKLNEHLSKFARKDMLKVIKSCGRPAYKPELHKFAAKCLGEITRAEYDLWKKNSGWRIAIK